MIEYITDVIQRGETTFVVSVNGKSATVKYTAESKSTYNDTVHQEYYQYGAVTVYGDMTVSSSGAHLAEIVVAVEVVKVIKEELSK